MSARKRTPVSAPVPESKKRNGPIAAWKHHVMARRRSEAEARQAARDSRGDEGQLARLDALFGVGQGAQRERSRLAKRLEQAA